MDYTIRYKLLGFLAVACLLVSSCQQPGSNSTGSEYIPEMVHSISYEANVLDYYYYNTWGTEEAYYKMAQPRKPVQGTIARAYAGAATDGSASVNAVKVRLNGAMPYYYADTEEERSRAANEIISNPYPITEKGLATGKELYVLYCAVCHGEKGDGAGIIYENGAYPAAPANFLQDTFYNSSNGRFYHSIIYGKNVMAGYTDKLSYEERWQVIHYIHSLQAKARKLVYNETANTLNNVDIPAASIKQEAVHEEATDAQTESDHAEEEATVPNDAHGSDGGHH